MNKIAEAIVFPAFSAALLLAGFVTLPQDGSEAGGVGGDTLVSIAAAAPSVAQMVETWERPPEMQPQIESSLASPALSTRPSPSVPAFDLASAPRASVQIATMPPPAQDQPETIDTVPPPPLPKPEPKPIPEPTPEQKPEPVPEPKPVPEPEQQQAEQAQVTSAGRAAQKAAGSGGQREAGASNTGQTTTKSSGQEAKLARVWGARIRAAIERRKRAPREKLGGGRVILRLTISADGTLLRHSLSKSSGKAAYDQAALRAISSIRRFPKAPKQLAGTQHTFNLPIDFED